MEQRQKSTHAIKETVHGCQEGVEHALGLSLAKHNVCKCFLLRDHALETRLCLETIGVDRLGFGKPLGLSLFELLLEKRNFILSLSPLEVVHLALLRLEPLRKLVLLLTVEPSRMSSTM
jgi:hypothetical protein